jgi:hypothetical protein
MIWNTGILGTTAGMGIGITTMNGNATITNMGILSTFASTGIGISTNSNASTMIWNTGILSTIGGTGIGITTVNGNATITNTGVTKIVPGTNVTISPSGGTGEVTINAASNKGVTQITAGSNITISPSGGTGNVTMGLLNSIILGQISIDNTIPGANLYVNSQDVSYYGVGSTDYYMYLSPNILVQWGGRASPGNDAATTVTLLKPYYVYTPFIYVSPFGNPNAGIKGPAVVNSTVTTLSNFTCDANVGGQYKPGIYWFTFGIYK